MATREEVLAEVRLIGTAIENYPQFSDDREIVLEAIKQDPVAFRYVHDNLKADAQIVEAVIGRRRFPGSRGGYPELLEYADDSIKGNRELISRWIDDINPEVLRYASNTIKADRPLVLRAINKDPQLFVYLRNDPIGSDQAFVIRAMIDQPSVLQYAHNNVRSDRDFVLYAITQIPLVLRTNNYLLLDDFDFLIDALNINPTCVQYVHSINTKLLTKYVTEQLVQIRNSEHIVNVFSKHPVTKPSLGSPMLRDVMVQVDHFAKRNQKEFIEGVPESKKEVTIVGDQVVRTTKHSKDKLERVSAILRGGTTVTPLPPLPVPPGVAAVPPWAADVPPPPPGMAAVLPWAAAVPPPPPGAAAAPPGAAAAPPPPPGGGRRTKRKQKTNRTRKRKTKRR